MSANKYLRVYRAIVNSAGAELDNAGTIFFYDTSDTITNGTPDTAAKVFAAITPAHNQSLMAIYTIPLGYKGWLFHHYVDYAAADKRYILNGELLVRPFGGVFNIKHEMGDDRQDHQWEFPFPLEEKSDIKVALELSAAGIAYAGFDIILEKI